MKLKNILNESREFVVIDPRGNAKPVGSKIQAAQYTKKMGGPAKGWHIVLAKNATKARRAIEKNGGNASSSKVQDIMFDLMYEGDKKDDKEVLLGEGRIKSNIAQTWDSKNTILDDCRNFILQAVEAGGEDMARDLANAFKLLSNYALGEYKKSKK
tara:strand:+ start:563 stop:1030 length:468 start_codon:yes stop_codon:yes gene_type:complete